MGIELIFISLSLVAVIITRGSLKKALTAFSHTWTLGLAIAGQLVMEFAPIKESQYDSIGLGVLLFTYVMLFGFCCANINLRGMWIVLTGTAMNAFVIGLNKGMPVTTSGDFTVQESIKHQAATSTDLLPWLGDIIPINALSMAISVGDVIFAIGVMIVMISASRRSTEKVVDIENDVVDMEDEEEVTMETVMTEAALSKKALVLAGVMDNDEYIDIREDDLEPIPAHVSEETTHEPEEVPVTAVVVEEASQPRMQVKSQRHVSRRAKKRWHKTHGLNALPSKEELGYDEESMTIVESAE